MVDKLVGLFLQRLTEPTLLPVVGSVWASEVYTSFHSVQKAELRHMEKLEGNL